MNPGRIVHLNKKICQSTNLKEDGHIVLCGIAKKSST